MSTGTKQGRLIYSPVSSSDPICNLFKRFLWSVSCSPSVKWVLNAKCFEPIGIT